MNVLQICPPYLSDVDTLPRKIPKSHFPFNSMIHTYFLLFTNSNCCTATLTVYLLLFSASYYLHSPSTASRHATGGARVAACGSGLLRHGLNFSTAWCTVRLISVEKDLKHVLMQKVVTLNASS